MTHNLVEGAGAMGFAALPKLRDRLAGKRVGDRSSAAATSTSATTAASGFWIAGDCDDAVLGPGLGAQVSCSTSAT